MIMVFDLDDTLYNEIHYVESGFKAVSGFISSQWQLNRDEVYNLLIQALSSKGRGHVFDSVLSYYGQLSKQNVRRCIGVYRRHMPSIELHKAGARCMKRFHSWPRYLVTDGNKLVQNNKVVALRLQPQFKRIMITHQFGVARAKPSPYCFELIAKAENLEPPQIIYIGDNPAKDFVGIKPLGFRTIRVLTGAHRNVCKPDHYEAETTIKTLDELTPAFLEQLQST